MDLLRFGTEYLCPVCFRKEKLRPILAFQINRYQALYSCCEPSCDFPKVDSPYYIPPFQRHYDNRHEIINYPSVYYGPLPDFKEYVEPSKFKALQRMSESSSSSEDITDKTGETSSEEATHTEAGTSTPSCSHEKSKRAASYDEQGASSSLRSNSEAAKRDYTIRFKKPKYE